MRGVRLMLGVTVIVGMAEGVEVEVAVAVGVMEAVGRKMA
jgi:hypothetical protein